MNRPPLHKPALIGVCIAAVYAVAVALLGGAGGVAAWCDLAFYLMLLVNTYFSIRYTEHAYCVRGLQDVLICLPLIAGYAAAPWLVAQPMHFYLLMTGFFMLAAIRYANWLQVVDDAFFLRRKVTANVSGGLMSLAMVVGIVLTGRDDAVAVVGAVLYLGGNVQTLWFDPLYRTEVPPPPAKLTAK